jgi:ATP synthase protein I
MLKVLMLQIGVGAILTVVLWGIYGPVAGYSVLLGSLTCAIPNALLALRLAAPRWDPGAKELVRAAYIGELGKLAITVAMFASVFALVRPLAVAALFAGFIAAQLMTFAGLLMKDGPHTEKSTRTDDGE